MAGKKAGESQQVRLDFGAFEDTPKPALCRQGEPESAWTPPQKAEPVVLTVFELAKRIVQTLDTQLLTNVIVAGEITGFRPHSSGHLYFSLSEHGDEKATITCVMWKFAAKSVNFPVKDGALVRATGHVDYYPPFGKLQFVIKKLEPAFEGKAGLYLLKEQWKKQLEEEGVIPRKELDKRCLPLFPKTLGVVTSRTGSVLQDIRNVVSRRFPLPIYLAHTSVQGDGAHKEIVNAILSLQDKADVIIIARGGGSFEDLFEFNHPEVVKAVANSRVPVISAVGHETDTTLADFAADLRSPTPSAAAESVVPDRTVLLSSLEETRRSMYDRVSAKFLLEKKTLQELSIRLDAEKLSRKLSGMQGVVAEFEERITSAMQRKLSAEQEVCEKLKFEIAKLTKNKIRSASLELAAEKEIILAKNPYKPLEKGYALVFRDGNVVRSVSGIAEYDQLCLKLSDGKITTTVEEIYDRTT